MNDALHATHQLFKKLNFNLSSIVLINRMLFCLFSTDWIHAHHLIFAEILGPGKTCFPGCRPHVARNYLSWEPFLAVQAKVGVWFSSLFSMVLDFLRFLLGTYLTEVHSLIREKSELPHRMARGHVWGLLVIIRF